MCYPREVDGCAALGCQHSAPSSLSDIISMLGHLLAIPALVAPSQPAPGRAAAAGGSSFWSDAWTNAQLQGSSWRLKLDIGREPGMQLCGKQGQLGLGKTQDG